MSQAIVTKFLSPTNTKGTRIKATCAAGSLTLNWEYEESSEENHRLAAQKLRDRLGWSGSLISGCLPDGNYCHCLCSTVEAAQHILALRFKGELNDNLNPYSTNSPWYPLQCAIQSDLDSDTI